MGEESDDPYELHAWRFLQKLQQQSKEFSGGVTEVEVSLRKLEKTWPQVLSAFWWASRERSHSSQAEEICRAILACADGDIGELQAKRHSSDVMKLSKGVRARAHRQENPNDAAFLYRIAGVALTQARILEMAEETGANVHSLMGELLEIVKEDQKKKTK